MTCQRCGDLLDEDAPAWQTLCGDCYRKVKRAENDTLLRRALEAEHKVELAKKVVIELQGKVRTLEGKLRAANGRVGVQRGPPVAGSGLDLATLQRMRRLCHPDKHNNSPVANEITQLINQLIEQHNG